MFLSGRNSRRESSVRDLYAFIPACLQRWFFAMYDVGSYIEGGKNDGSKLRDDEKGKNK